jgi:hypothetical protein
VVASTEQITELRAMISEPTTATYSDETLSTRIDAAKDDLSAVAASIWTEKAGSYALLVDVQEGSSKRSLGALGANALKMAAYYRGIVDAATVAVGRGSRTRQIERP